MATKGDISDLDVLKFGGKPIVPQVAIGGFSRRRNSGVVNSDTSGGASRQRVRYYGGVHVAPVTFYLETPAQQDFMEMFVDKNKGKKWICHLQADRPIVEPYVVQTVSEWEFGSVNAKDATVTLTLEIFSARDECLDNFLYSLYPCVGDDMYCWLKAWGQVSKAIPQ